MQCKYLHTQKRWDRWRLQEYYCNTNIVQHAYKILNNCSSRMDFLVTFSATILISSFIWKSHLQFFITSFYLNSFYNLDHMWILVCSSNQSFFLEDVYILKKTLLPYTANISPYSTHYAYYTQYHYYYGFYTLEIK